MARTERSCASACAATAAFGRVSITSGTLGHATIFVGLIAPSRALEGVACFSYGPSGNIRSLIGEPAMCLERGACVPDAPPNAASFLITPTPASWSTASPNWVYMGQGLNG